MSDPLVTHLLWSFARAGAERVVLDLATRLPAKGFRVRVLSVTGGGSLLEDFRSAGVETVVGPEHVSRAASVRFLREQIRRERPAIWHTHLGGDLWGGLAGRLERLRPWVVTAHNVDQDLAFPYRIARRLAWQSADRVVCVSSAVRRYAERNFGVSGSRTLVIPNGIDLHGRPLREPRPFRDVPQLLCVGRLVLQKGHATLLEALAGIAQPWELTLVGAGSLETELRRHCERLGILPRVRFTGAVTNVAERLASADLFCFPSLWEGQGLTLLEAAAANLPILVSDLPVIREMFDESSVAFADPGSVTSWRSAIVRVLSDASSALRRTASARQIVESRYTVDQMVDSYASLYAKLLAT